VNSTFGRLSSPIRENEDLAESIGIDAFKYCHRGDREFLDRRGRRFALRPLRGSFIDPNVFAFFISVNAVMDGDRGGTGNPGRAPSRGDPLHLIPEWLRVFGDARMAVYALMVIFIVIFMPKGMLYYVTKIFEPGKKRTMAAELLKVDHLTVRFGGLTAGQRRGLHHMLRRDRQPDRAERGGEDHDLSTPSPAF